MYPGLLANWILSVVTISASHQKKEGDARHVQQRRDNGLGWFNPWTLPPWPPYAGACVQLEAGSLLRRLPATPADDLCTHYFPIPGRRVLIAAPARRQAGRSPSDSESICPSRPGPDGVGADPAGPRPAAAQGCSVGPATVAALTVEYEYSVSPGVFCAGPAGILTHGRPTEPTAGQPLT